MEPIMTTTKRITNATDAPEAQAKIHRHNSFDLTQDMAEGGLPADRGWRDGAEPLPRQLLCGSGAGSLLANIIPGIGFSPDSR